MGNNNRGKGHLRGKHTAVRIKREPKGSRTKAAFGLPEFSAVKGRIVESLKEGRESQRMLQRRHRTAMQEDIVKVYHLARFLAQSPDDWLDLIRQPEWKGFRGRPAEMHRLRPLKHVLRYHVGFDGGNSKRKVSKLFRAFEKPFEEGVPSEQIMVMLKKEGGITGFLKRRREAMLEEAEPAENKRPRVTLAKVDSNLVSKLQLIGDRSTLSARISMSVRGNGTIVLQLENVNPRLPERAQNLHQITL